MSVTIVGEILRESDAAICIKLHMEDFPHKDGENEWFPLSQVEEIHREKGKGHKENDRLVVTDWIAKMKDLV